MCSVLSTSMNSSPRPYLNVTRSASTQRGMSSDLLVLDVDALDRADALGEVEHLGLAERLGGEPAAVLLPDDRRVQALLDRRPDRERRREVVAVDDEVGAVAHADLVDRRRTGGRRRSGRRRRTSPGSTPMPTSASRPAPPIRRRARTARRRASRRSARTGRSGCGSRQRHRHVEVVDAGRERGAKDRHHEPRVGRVEHRVDPVLGDQRLDRRLVGGVEPRGDEPTSPVAAAARSARATS